MTPEVVLETERMRLRRFTDCDADAALLYDLDSDPEVMRFIGPYLLPNVEAHRQKIRERFLPQYTHAYRGCLATEDKASGVFLGWFFLRPSPDYIFAKQVDWSRPSDLELGYRLRRIAWGKGVATEGAKALMELALADTEVTAVVAAALLPNVGSWRVMENCGMTRIRTVPIPDLSDPLVIYERKRSE